MSPGFSYFLVWVCGLWLIYTLCGWLGQGYRAGGTLIGWAAWTIGVIIFAMVRTVFWSGT